MTGGAGFIGANLVREFLVGGDTVTVLDDFSTGERMNLDGCDALIVQGSVLDAVALDEALDGAEAIVHLAARPSVPRSLADPLASHHANATGTLQVLEAARRAGEPYVIVASSSSVYGANRTMPKSEDLVPMPVSPYAVSKLATESYALSYGACFGLKVLAFRFFNVYGPYQRAGRKRNDDPVRRRAPARDFRPTGQSGVRHEGFVARPGCRARAGTRQTPAHDSLRPAHGRRARLAGRQFSPLGAVPLSRSHSTASRPAFHRRLVPEGRRVGQPIPGSTEARMTP